MFIGSFFDFLIKCCEGLIALVIDRREEFETSISFTIRHPTCPRKKPEPIESKEDKKKKKKKAVKKSFWRKEKRTTLFKGKVKIVEKHQCPETLPVVDVDEEQEVLRMLKILEEDFFKGDVKRRRQREKDKVDLPKLECIGFLFYLFYTHCDISTATIDRERVDAIIGLMGGKEAFEARKQSQDMYQLAWGQQLDFEEFLVEVHQFRMDDTDESGGHVYDKGADQWAFLTDINESFYLEHFGL